MKLLIAVPVTAAVAARARDEFGAGLPEKNMTTDEMIAAAVASRPQAILLSGKQKLDATAMAALPDSLQVIATHSVGYDHVDVAAARARGIAVTNTPDVLTDATADMAFLLMIMVARRAKDYLAVMEEGWRSPIGLHEMLGVDLAGKCLGIVGMGRIGQALAMRARAFGMTIAYHNRSRLAPDLEAGAEFHPDLATLLARAEVVSLNLPGSGGMLMTAERFAQMKQGAIFVNAARGSLVDEDALLAALDSGHLYGAGLDVFRAEPDFDLRFRGRRDVVAMPHMGSATQETRDAMGMRALDNIAAVLAGGVPRDAL